MTPPTVRLAGYAALFGIADAARDVIEPGAFRRTLAERSDPLPLYWQHRPRQRIGWVERAEEDARGLRIVARLDSAIGKAARLLIDGVVSGLSFGYRARRFRRIETTRWLDDIDLIEISLVAHPLQHGARVHLIS